MELLTKLEHLLQDWTKDLPHLPTAARKWLGEHIWWLAVILAAAAAIGILGLVMSLFGNLLSIDGGPFVSYYASATFVAWFTIKTIVSLVFAAIQCALLAFAIKPLRSRQKNGWVLLFVAWLLAVVSVVVDATLTLNAFNFIVNLIFGALWLALSGYLLFEIRGQFVQVERSKGARNAKA